MTTHIPIQSEDTDFVSSDSNTKPGGFLRGKRLTSPLNSNRNTARHPNTSRDFLRDNALTETSVLKGERYIPRKRFSQNFLQNKHIIERIVQAINPQITEHLVEIGPGLGALTQYLLPKIGAMDAIELDRDLIEPLTTACESLGKLTIHSADALRFDFSTLTEEPHSLRIVGNLPYQISTPLLFHLVEQIHFICDLHFMLQKEVVERMAAKTHTKAYGRLSVMIQYHFDVTPLFLVPNTAFYPIPKVTSQIVRLKPTVRKTVAADYNKFAEIVKQAFNYRRKTLHNSLRDYIDVPTLSSLGIDPNSRPEQLTVEDFIKISL